MYKLANVHTYGDEHHEYCKKISELFKVSNPIAYVKTYGCQQNVADSEKYKGMLIEMGFKISDDCENADIVLFNTCAIRENAENKVFGNIGRIKFLKSKKPSMIVILCGCMTQQKGIISKLKSKYTFLDIVFGTHVSHKFPEILYNFLKSRSSKNFTQYISSDQDSVFEGAPLKRGSKIKAFVSVMSGCNNFCSYCIVPYVRGRERSRDSENILNECKSLIDVGYKDITLLGQNVNSYGKNLSEKINFPTLLKKLDQFDSEYKIRFMTSHPKDATCELFDTIASGKHISKHIHLPVQCGSNRILEKMNRKYTKESYISIINYARSKIPNVSFTSDIIVGFPGESYEDFKETIQLIKQVRFSSLFTFIFSPRQGTAAYNLCDTVSKEEKTKWLMELLKVQEKISEEIRSEMVGRVERVLVEDYCEEQKYLVCRTDENISVKVPFAKNLSNSFINVKIINYSRDTLMGSVI